MGRLVGFEPTTFGTTIRSRLTDAHYQASNSLINRNWGLPRGAPKAPVTGKVTGKVDWSRRLAEMTPIKPSLLRHLAAHQLPQRRIHGQRTARAGAGNLHGSHAPRG